MIAASITQVAAVVVAALAVLAGVLLLSCETSKAWRLWRDEQ